MAVQVHRHLSSGPGCLLPQQLQAFTFAWPGGPPGRPSAGRGNGPHASDVSGGQAGSSTTPLGSGTERRAGGASDTGPGLAAGSGEHTRAGNGSASSPPAAGAAAGTGQAVTSSSGMPGSGVGRTGDGLAGVVSSDLPQQEEFGETEPPAADLSKVAASSNGASSPGTAAANGASSQQAALAGLPIEGTPDTDSDDDVDGGYGRAPAVASSAAGGTAAAAAATAHAAGAAANALAAGNAEMGASGAASQAEPLRTCTARQSGAGTAHPAGLDRQAGPELAEGQSSSGARQPASATAGPALHPGSGGCASGVSGVQATDGTAGGLARVRACLAQHNLSAALRCLPGGTGEGPPRCLMHWLAWMCTGIPQQVRLCLICNVEHAELCLLRAWLTST